jgi:hypothetical protein
MNSEDFKNKYRKKRYIGDGSFVHFDGYHFILSTPREDGTHWIGLEPPVFEELVAYRREVYEAAKNIEREDTE